MTLVLSFGKQRRLLSDSQRTRIVHPIAATIRNGGNYDATAAATAADALNVPLTVL